MPLSIEELERRAREQLDPNTPGYTFAPPQPPPRAPASTTEQLGREFLSAATPYFNFMGAPAGLGLSGVRAPPVTARPSAPLSPAGARGGYVEPPPMTQVPVSSPAFLRGLSSSQRSLIQSRLDAGYTQSEIRALADSFRQQAQPAGPPQFDINRFRPPERGRVKPGMSAVQQEVSKTYGEAAATPSGPSYGELGNFLEPPMPGQTQRPPALADRLAQLPNPARRDLGYEMPIGEIAKGRREWSIPYEPGGQVKGEIIGNLTPEGLQIKGSNLPQSAQGKGIGQEMYRRFIDEAHRDFPGQPVGSDEILSPFSNRIYDPTLSGQGYNVVRDPRAVDRGRGRYPHTSDYGPVYKVYPKERLPSPRLMDMLMRVPKKSDY